MKDMNYDISNCIAGTYMKPHHADNTYYYYIKDYQGNVRAVLNEDYRVVEKNEYYPYGGLINASDNQLQRLFTINIGNINWER